MVEEARNPECHYSVDGRGRLRNWSNHSVIPYARFPKMADPVKNRIRLAAPYRVCSLPFETNYGTFYRKKISFPLRHDFD